MTRNQIAAACHRAGLPPPIFDGDTATITVKVRPDVPKISSRTFNRWCGKVGHAGVARFINAQIGTNYPSGSVYRMRSQLAPISTNIRQLVRDFPDGPVDPKPRPKPRKEKP